MRIKYVLTHHSLARSLTHSEQNIVYICHAAAAAATSECIRTDVNKIYSQIRCKDCINLIVSKSTCKQVHTTHITRCVRDSKTTD